MPTTYQPLAIPDADLAALQAAFPAFGVTRNPIGADQYILNGLKQRQRCRYSARVGAQR
jgi:hypothetical protein